MVKKEKNSKVGRPKLADPELIKDSWCKVAACLSAVLVMTVCAVGVLTMRTPLQVLTFQNPNKIQGNALNTKNTTSVNGNTKVIKAKKTTVKIIKPNGEVTYIIPAKEASN